MKKVVFPVSYPLNLRIIGFKHSPIPAHYQRTYRVGIGLRSPLAHGF